MMLHNVFLHTPQHVWQPVKGIEIGKCLNLYSSCPTVQKHPITIITRLRQQREQPQYDEATA